MMMKKAITTKVNTSGSRPHQFEPWKKATSAAIAPATTGPTIGRNSSKPDTRPNTSALRTPMMLNPMVTTTAITSPRTIWPRRKAAQMRSRAACSRVQSY